MAKKSGLSDRLSNINKKKERGSTFRRGRINFT